VDILESDLAGSASDGVIERQEGSVKRGFPYEAGLDYVYFGEVFIEGTEGVAEEGACVFWSELGGCPHAKDDCTGNIRGVGGCKDIAGKVHARLPVGGRQFAFEEAKHAFGVSSA
jgi:hypothetical protein